MIAVLEDVVGAAINTMPPLGMATLQGSMEKAKKIASLLMDPCNVKHRKKDGLQA